jgi:23S rRNA (adenine2503-C2)-methyltransferase
MDLKLLDQTLADHGEPRFRARQVWAWAAKGAHGYEQMTNIPYALREALARELPFSSLRLREEKHASDGTVKALFETEDGRPLEAVLMRYRAGRRSICVSSQSGCPLTCTFCATGQMRFARNLTASEIVEQALHFRRVEPVDHCVFMGMGEPMLNLENVLEACERLPDVGITHRRTAISTVGWIPGIERLAEQEMPLRLALSLHAADEALRSELMPVNERYPLRDVIDACRAFYARKRRRVFVEYVMLAGINDRYEQALALAKLLAVRTPVRAVSAPARNPSGHGPNAHGRGSTTTREAQIFKVNLIPYNPTDSAFRGSGRDAIAAFKAALERHGLRATVRLTRGRDIDAACGQLAARG